MTRHVPFLVLCITACAPDIPNYEGFWDDEARKRCGNGEIDFHSEECDAGEANSLSGFCSPECKKARCGDGILQLDEQCDLGSENAEDAPCSLRCTFTSCGDGVVQIGENCDDGNDNTDVPYGGGCSNQCQVIPRCGDGTLDQAHEQCDDGNDDETDACLSTCQHASCGDGFVYAGMESCDDGNEDDTDACTSTCEPPACGDGIVQAGEECDGQTNCNELCIRDRYVFASSDALRGDLKMASNLSGVEVADSLCRGRANSSGLKTDADFLAWISDDTTSPAERFFRSSGRYILPDGTPIAESWDDLTDGTLQNPIDMTEVMGIPEAHHAWTNTAPDGTRLSDDSCNNWASNEPLANSYVGGTTMIDEEWSNRAVPISCGIENHIYCFEQGPK